MGESPDIELIGITKRFKDGLAVDHVDLKVSRGSFFSLLGPSGCGKTTTLRIIAGLESPDEGEIRLRGNRVNDVPPFKRNLGMVFQGLALFPHLNVFNNVSYGLRVRRRPASVIRKKVKEYLGLVGLEGMGARRIPQLSGGQQQRVALARALVTEPSVLLLDEPLGALDLKLRTQMQLELKRIHRQIGTTFVFVTHDQGEAMAMSDRVAVMSKGHVEQEGPPEEIYFRPRTSFVADFIGETNLLEGTLEDGVVRLAGDVQLRAPVELRGTTSSRVLVAIRPEVISIGDESRSREIRSTATVEETVFRGMNGILQVRLEGDLRLTVQVDGTIASRISVGSPLELGFDLDTVRIFPTDG